jgi:uncharacterized membrane protein
MTATVTHHRPSRLSRRARHAWLTAHIVSSVGLLGASSAVAAIALRARATDDPAEVRNAGEILESFGFTFGIPLSLATVVTGVVLGLGSRWGVVRHGWVIAKLAIIVSVMANGALILGPAEAITAEAATVPGRLIPAALYNVVALCIATGLSVFKPSRRRRGTQEVGSNR